MIGYVTLGANDLDRQRSFYADLLATIGAKQLMREEESGFTVFGVDFGQPAIAVTRPHNGEPATVGNGNMVALTMDTRDKVDAMHASALSLGGSCDGPPGLRGGEGPMAFYAAYFRDPEGNKLCVYKLGPEG